MVDLRHLTKDDLGQPEVFERLTSETREIVNDVRGGDARRLARVLDTAMKAAKDAGESVVEESAYGVILSELQAVSLPQQNEREIIEFFRSDLPAALQNDDIDVLDRTRAAMMTQLLDDRDRIKESIRRAVRENRQRLTRTSFVAPDGSRTTGTVGRWIEELHRVVGTELRTINLAEFFSQSEVVKRLPPAEKKLLRKLFKLYMYLGQSSYDFEGNEEGIVIDEGRVVRILQGGTVTEIRKGGESPNRGIQPRSVATTKQSLVQTSTQLLPEGTPVAQLMAKYEEYVAGQRTSKAIERAIPATTGTNIKKLKQELGAAITAKDVNRSLACLRLLAKSGNLTRILVNEPTVQQWLTDYLERKYGTTYEAKTAIADLMNRPTSPEAVSEFLQFVLQERLGLSGEDSALVAVELGLLLKAAGRPAFEHLAYGDTNTLTFSWVGHRIENGKYVREVP